MTTMTAPLSLFLTRFSAPPPIAVEVAPPAPEPTVTLRQVDLDAQLADAAQVARADAEQRHAAEIAALVSASETAMAEALANARAEWTETAGERFAAVIELQVTTLRTAVADGLTRTLRPLLTEAACARTLQALTETLDSLLGDPSQPAIRVRGPEDLLAKMKHARPATGIEWIVADMAEITITAGATHIETRLAAALAEIASTETSHVG